MIYVKSIAIWVAGFILTVIHFLVDLFFAIILFPFDKKRKVVHAQGFWWADALIGLNPYWNLKAAGLENIDRKRTYIIVANHQSLADIMVLYKTRMQFKWVAKEVLFKVPFVGWCLSLGKHINLLRGDLGSIKDAYREAGEWLKKDISVLFFPEGTRSETGEIQEFQNGAFKLAIKEKKPVLPVLIDGTRDAIPKGGWIFETKVDALIKVLPAFETKDLKMGDFAGLRDSVREKLISEQAKIA
jgi:1-acyl-sn-glycerol-3-phosphate acyltransferase